MHLVLSSLFALLTITSADFFISRSFVCMGTGLAQNCYYGVKVLSGTSETTDYTCSHLVPAEDRHYIHNETAGPHGSDYIASAGGICDSGQLKFIKDGEEYIVNDKNDQHVGDCHWDNGTSRLCSQWIGMLRFQSMFRCISSVCD